MLLAIALKREAVVGLYKDLNTSVEKPTEVFFNGLNEKKLLVSPIHTFDVDKRILLAELLYYDSGDIWSTQPAVSCSTDHAGSSRVVRLLYDHAWMENSLLN